MKKILEGRGLSIAFDDLKALSNVDIDLNKGDTLGVIGPYKSGKSTLLKILSCRMKPDVGELFISNIDARAEPKIVKKMIGTLPDKEDLDWDFSAQDNLSVFASYFGLPKNEVKKKTRELFQSFNLEGFEDRPLDLLDEDQLRKVNFCRCLVTNPELLIIDEPTTGMSLKTKIQIRTELLKQKSLKKSMIIATEDIKDVEGICSKVIILSNGKVIASGVPSELVKDKVGEEVVEFSIESRDLDYYMSKIKGNYDYKVLHNSVRLFLKPGQSPKDAIKCFSSKNILIRKATLEDVYARVANKDFKQVRV